MIQTWQIIAWFGLVAFALLMAWSVRRKRPRCMTSRLVAKREYYVGKVWVCEFTYEYD